jgi:hypothetical protein
MVEVNDRVCKVCNVKKQRIFDGKYPNSRDKKWRDETGLLWSGNVCGSCNRDRAKNVMKKARSNEKS